jgi:hypothetical protein
MEEKQISAVLLVLGILTALIGDAFMWFGITPLSLRITIIILGISLIALSKPKEKSRKT